MVGKHHTMNHIMEGVVPEITLKDQRVMSRHQELRNFLKGAFSSVNYIRINP
jgi:hypothetical protein